MAVTSEQDPPSPTFIQTVNEITQIYKSLPTRPTIEELEAAMSVLKTINEEEEKKLEGISNEEVPKDFPEELFSVSREVKKNMVLFQSYEQKREAIHLVELDKMFQTFDDLIQRASGFVSGDTQSEEIVILGDPVEKTGRESVISDQSLLKKMENGESEKIGEKGLLRSSSMKASISSGEGENGKMSLMKVAALIETFAKKGSLVLDLGNKLMDQIEWLPLTIGKLSYVSKINLSENKIMALPTTIIGLKSLTKLDIHSNQLINLPGSFGELISLTDLDLHANRLKSLPGSFGNLINLINLDLSSNNFTHLPETVGKLTRLKRLNVETNDLEELPYTIGSCSSLIELRLDFNQLKGLPEAIGKLEALEILTLHYNRISRLPTTMSSLLNLKELDVSFNELESIPESLCFAVSLKKLNVGKNFADLRTLPRSIGNLEKLEELDISANQIKVLPDSFRFLSNLRVLRADETPLDDPPREMLKLGAQSVVQYMAEAVAKKDAKSQPTKTEKKKKKGFWFWVFSIICSNKGNKPNKKYN